MIRSIVISLLALQVLLPAFGKNNLSKLIKEERYDRIVYLFKYSDNPSDTLTAGTFYACLHNKDYVSAYKVYSYFNQRNNIRKSLYNNSTYIMYVSLCVEALDITISQKDAELYLEMFRVSGVSNDRVIAKVLMDIARAFEYYGDSRLAHYYYSQVLQYRNKIDPFYFCRYLNDIAWSYQTNHQHQRAFLLIREQADYYKEKFGIYSIQYTKLLIQLSYIGRFINRNTKSYITEAKNIIEQRGDTLSNTYATCLDNLCAYYRTHSIIDSALCYGLKANRLYKNIDSLGVDYAISLSNLASIYIQLSRNNKKYIENVRTCYEKSVQLSNTNTNFFNAACFYLNEFGNKEKAFELLDKVSDYDRNNSFANEVADFYVLLNDWDNYAKYKGQYIAYRRDLMRNNVLYMSSKERDYYVNIFQNEDLGSLFHFASEQKHDSLGAYCYDYLLMSRYLLLSFGSNIEEIVYKSRNQNLKNLYLTLNVAHKNLEKGISRQEQIDSLEHVFLDSLSIEGEFSDFVNLRYSDVQKHIKESDVAIEFFVADYGKDTSLYAVILNDSGLPIVKWCMTKEEMNIFINGDTLGDVLYERLQNEIKGKTKVFFVPCDALCSYPLESTIILQDTTLNMFRLSSTRELVLNHKRNCNRAVLYGGIDYSNALYDQNAPFRESERVDSTFYVAQVRGSVNALDSLPGTRKEARFIFEILKRNGLNPKLYINDDATEKSFKNLNSTGVGLIHVGTHGFYVNTGNITNSMSSCGLYFAGANKYINNQYDYDVYNEFDGVLTAQSIADMDLRGLDLVTLSACETGLGEQSPDGVFGLQRGFKKAGANSILMSLWKVDDEATCKLMMEFYSNWISNNMTKQAALEKAKKTIRETKGWENPKYWAAFILLDGLD